MTLQEIGKIWEEAMKIRSNCSNVTSQELGLIKHLVDQFNQYKGQNVISRVSGCQISHICSVIQKELFENGLLEGRYAKTITVKRIYEF